MRLISLIGDWVISQIQLTDAKTARLDAETALIHAEVSATDEPATTGPDEDDREPQPQGNNFSDAQLSHQSDFNHELNGNDRPGHYGRSISMRWQPPEP